MADRDPSTIEVIERRLALAKRALEQPAFVRMQEFQAAWDACATDRVPVPDEDAPG